MPESIVTRLQPLWNEAVLAFLTDPTYAIDIARAGSACKASKSRQK